MYYNFCEKNKFCDLFCIFYSKLCIVRVMFNLGFLLVVLSCFFDFLGFCKIDFKGKNIFFKGECFFYFGSDYVIKGNVFFEY